MNDATPPTGGRRGARISLGDSIFEDAIGISALACVGKRQKEKRFRRGTPIKEITAWQERTRVKMRQEQTRARRMRGTLEGDIVAYLATLPDGAYKNHKRWELAPWVTALGDIHRDRLTTLRLQDVVRRWTEAEVAASTIKHRRRALAQLYEALDGAGAENPARAVKAPRAFRGEARAWPMDVLTAIIDGMNRDYGERQAGQSSLGGGRRNKSQARLRMLLWTGMPPIGLKQLSPRRVAFELEAGRLWYPERNKGQGAEAKLLALYPEGRVSVARWLQAGAWGKTFSNSSLNKALRRATATYATREAKAGRSSPIAADDITPYDLRHSFLTWLYEVSGDPYLVQLYGQHADLETTRIYTQKGVPARAAEAVARIEAEWAAKKAAGR